MPLLPPGFWRKTRGIIRRGTRADQPDADTVVEGTLYYVTDESTTERSNGVAWETYADSSASGLAIGDPITSSTEGALLLVGPGDVLDQDPSNLFWDSVNERLGIGRGSVATPAAVLDVRGNANGDGYVAKFLSKNNNCFFGLQAAGGNANFGVGFTFINDAGQINIQLGNNSGVAYLTFFVASGFKFQFTDDGMLIIGDDVTKQPGSGTNCLVLQDGTAPGSPGSDTSLLYTDLVGGVGMTFAMAESGDITRVNHVNRALGGGAGATLGTIGGSGPTTAAQHSWMEYQHNGTTYWIPVWQ